MIKVDFYSKPKSHHFYDDSLFTPFNPANQALFTQSWKSDDTPKVGYLPSEAGWTATYELPGFKKGEVSIELNTDNSTLLIDAVKKNDKGELIKSREFDLVLNEQVDSDKISAKLEDGLLTVTLLKKVESPRKKIVVT